MSQATSQTTTIDLLRHGQCQGGEIFRGSTDVALTEHGWQQMENTLASLSGWQQIVSSPLLRCHAFASDLAQKLQLPISHCDALREIHFGDWEGRPHEEIQKNQGELLRKFWHDPLSMTPPNGEHITDFQQRVVGSFEQHLDEHRGKHWLLVAHGAVIRVLMCHLLSMPLSALSSIAIPYAGITRFRIYETEGEKPWVQLCLHRGE